MIPHHAAALAGLTAGALLVTRSITGAPFNGADLALLIITITTAIYLTFTTPAAERNTP